MELKKGNIIYEFLKILNQKGELSFSEISSIDIDACYDGEIIDYIKENDLIRSKGEEFKAASFVYITENGKNVLNYNSWNEYKESKDKLVKDKLEKIKERQVKQDKKLDIDIYLGDFEKKFGTKFKTWGFLITAVNITIVVVGLIISNRNNNQSKDLSNPQQERIEKNIQSLNNRILQLERKNDSLNHLYYEANGKSK